MTLGHTGHDRGDVPCPLRDSARVDTPVQDPIVARQLVGSVLAERPTVNPDISSPLNAGQSGGLVRQLFRRQQASGARIPQRGATHGVIIRDGVGAEPLREHDFHQQVLEVIDMRAALETIPESASQPHHFRVLGAGGQQKPLEVGIRGILGRLGNFPAHDGGPPELDGSLREALVGNNPFRQPLQAIVRVGRLLAGETRKAHVAVPGIAVVVRVGIHDYRQSCETVLSVLLVPGCPGYDLDVVDPVTRDLDVNVERAMAMTVPHHQVVTTSRGGIVPCFPAWPPISDWRSQVLELVAGQYLAVGIGHPEQVKINHSVFAGVFIIEIVREFYPQGLNTGGQPYGPDQRLPLGPGFPIDGQLAPCNRVLVEIVQRILASPPIPVVPVVPVVLKGACHRIQNAVTDRAGRVVHGGVVGVCQCHRVGGARGRFLHVETQKVVVGPPRPRPVAVRGRRWVTSQKHRRIENTGVWITRNQGSRIIDAKCLHVGVIFGFVSFTLPVVFHDPGRPELVCVRGVAEVGRGAVGRCRPWVCHDVVGRQYLGVRQVVLHHVRDQLQGCPPRTVLHFVHPVVVGSQAAAGIRCLPALVSLVGELDEESHVIVEHVAVVPVRQQLVVASADQELVELGPRHQTPNRGAQDRFVALLYCSVFLVRRNAARKDQRRTAQRLAGRRHYHRVEQRFRRQGRRRQPFAQQCQETFHVRKVHGPWQQLSQATVPQRTLNLEQDILSAALFFGQEILYGCQVSRLVVVGRI